MIGLEDKIRFHKAIDVMEIDFTNLVFADETVVHPVYDALERRLSQTGRKWYFLVNYTNCRIAPQSWSAFAQRGKQLNIEYSLGSVRFGAAESTKAEIDTAADIEEFDANLVATREEALVRIGALRHERAGGKDVATASAPPENHELGGRIHFNDAIDVMDVDFADWTFSDPATVNAFYDELERQLAATRRKWYFLVNYRNCRIFPEAWVSFAHRGKRLNVGYSLGTVRYDASQQTCAQIEDRAEKEKFDPNLFRSREDALRWIDGLRSGGRA